MAIEQVEELNEKLAKLMNERIREGRTKQQHEQERELLKQKQGYTEKLLKSKNELSECFAQQTQIKNSEFVIFNRIVR